MIDHLEKGITITDTRLREAIKAKIECCFTNKQPVHNATVTKYVVHEAEFQLMENNPYWPDLDSSDFVLLLFQARNTSGKDFEELMTIRYGHCWGFR